jgi:hypothetical protein
MLAAVAAAPRNEEGIHPIVAEIRDIILANAVDGNPTMEDHFAHLTLADIKNHFPAARALADKVIVRQLDDERGFETRAQLLARAAGVILGLMPSAGIMHDRLRAHGLTNNEIADLWPDLIATSAAAFERRHPQPFHIVAAGPGQSNQGKVN